ncbi:hypothetical protein KZO83_14865 [Chromohalobacter sp. TMW 2.2308]|nr:MULTISPECIES: hypothetical protein [Chromohalobacter]MCK2043977.1 hypothetical protein [Chromohalobacter moromii]MCT8515898.1 hypothetical protein [Chromohalobacter sp. TMW 2.2271]
MIYGVQLLKNLLKVWVVEMKKVCLSEYFELGVLSEGLVATPVDGLSVIDTPGIIDIKKQPFVFSILLRGHASVVYSEGDDKEIGEIECGELLVLEGGEEYLMLQEGASLLMMLEEVKDEKEKKGKAFGLLGKKSKNKISSSSDVEKVNSTSEKKGFMDDMLPRVTQIWVSAAGPITQNLINDEEKFKDVSSFVYSFLPFPVRSLLKEDVFVSWCYDNRHILLVEEKKHSAEFDKENDSLLADKEAVDKL